MAALPRPLLVLALLAYSVHEHQGGHARRAEVWLRPDSFTLQDDGRGIGLHKAGYVEALMGILVGGPGAVQLHGVGLALVAASTPRLDVESRRGGSLWQQSFAWGVANGPPVQQPASDDTGTRITFVGASASTEIEAAALDAQIAVWRARHPGLEIVVHR